MQFQRRPPREVKAQYSPLEILLECERLHDEDRFDELINFYQDHTQGNNMNTHEQKQLELNHSLTPLDHLYHKAEKAIEPVPSRLVLDQIFSADKDAEVLLPLYMYAINACTVELAKQARTYINTRIEGEDYTKRRPPEIDRKDLKLDADFEEDNERLIKEFYGMQQNDPYKNMCILQGLRFRLWEEARRLDPSIPSADIAANYERPHTLDEARIFNEPMSFQRMQNFLIRMTSDVREDTVAYQCSLHPDMEPEQVRKDLQEKATNNQTSWAAREDEITLEVFGLAGGNYDNAAFEALPLQMQLFILNKITGKVDVKQRQLYLNSSGKNAAKNAGLRALLLDEIKTITKLRDTLIKRNAYQLEMEAAA